MVTATKFYAVRVVRGQAVSFLAGSHEVRRINDAERFATIDRALDAGFVFVLRSPQTVCNVVNIDEEVTAI